MGADLASAINAAATTGIEAYEVSQGQPVSISNVGGVSTLSVGSAFAGVSGGVIIIGAIILGVVLLSRK